MIQLKKYALIKHNAAGFIQCGRTHAWLHCFHMIVEPTRGVKLQSHWYYMKTHHDGSVIWVNLDKRTV